jgi:purine-nucleoside phosphorylase
MSLHLDAEPGDIADIVLLPGDPLRAQFIAENYLENAVRHNRRRAAFGFTGTVHGTRVSVQSTGMGMPSLLIYAHELLVDYQAKTLIRVGTCGSLQPDLDIGAVILAMSACTDSATNRATFGGRDFAPTADFSLLSAAHAAAVTAGHDVHVGPVITSDVFYGDEGTYSTFAAHGVLAAEMETAALYTLAARHGARALSILTVSDVIGTSKIMPPNDRETAVGTMVELALAAALR